MKVINLNFLLLSITSCFLFIRGENNNAFQEDLVTVKDLVRKLINIYCLVALNLYLLNCFATVEYCRLSIVFTRALKNI